MTIVAVPFGVAWAFGGTGGAIWAGLNGDTLDIALSLVIPFYGFYYIVAHAL